MQIKFKSSYTRTRNTAKTKLKWNIQILSTYTRTYTHVKGHSADDRWDALHTTLIYC